MKLYIFFITLIYLSLTSLRVYAQDVEWLKHAGGIKSDKGSTIVLDDDGNTYITGYYNEQADFGLFNTGFSFQKSKEVFVAKMDPDGNFLWVTNALNYYDDRGLGLCLDPQGNVYVTGTCWGGLEWQGVNVYNSTMWSDQIFVTKLDSNGNFQWMKNAGVDDGDVIIAWWDPNQAIYCDDHGYDIISDSQGNLFVTGYLSSVNSSPTVAKFDGIHIPMNFGDTLGFLAKLSNNGMWQWVKTFEGVYMYRDNGIGIDNDDNVYIAGGFKGTRTFETDVLTSNQGSLDIFVMKYDNDGNYQYVKQVGDTLDDRADGITYGNDDHMYVTGEFRGEVYFGTDDLNNYGDPDDKDIFVSKMTKDGDWVWATKAGSKKGGDRGIGICANNDGNIFVAGQFRDNAKFGSLEVEAGMDSTQFFISMINDQGEWQWVVGGGGPHHDRFTSVAVDDSCNLYFIGFYKESATAQGHSLTSFGGNDIVIGKITDACKGLPPVEEEPEEDYSYNPVNVFSPNDDGVNDVLLFTDDPNAKGNIVIVNRWGTPIYESEDLTIGWNGNDVNGEPVVDGVYFYKVVFEFEFGVREDKSGFVTIVR